MALNCVKLGRAVTFFHKSISLPCQRSFLIFLAETLIWNKVTFPASNLLNVAELVVNEPMKCIYKKI